MKACTMANGAVFFIPDEVERKVTAVSYAELVAMEDAPAKPERKFTLLDRLMKRDRARPAQKNEIKAA